jgi:hypothetical protein
LGGLEVGVPLEDLLDAGPFTARFEKLDAWSSGQPSPPI